MARFLELERLDPHRGFAKLLSRHRLGMATAYGLAFAAHRRSGELEKRHLWSVMPRWEPIGIPELDLLPGAGDSADERDADLDAIWPMADAEDLQADMQAGLVIVTADELLQRFAKLVLGKRPGLDPGFGPTYGGFNGAAPVHLTTLLRAGTNTIRHVYDWDDRPELQRLPYPQITEVGTDRELKMALQNIAILQRAFGIGHYELIRGSQAFRVLVSVDGQLGSNPGPDYNRFEAAVIDAARAIAQHAGTDHLVKLDEAVARPVFVAG
jgi:hypothetical protein